MGFHFYPEEQRRIDTGKMVTNALQLMDGRASMDKLLELISSYHGLATENFESPLKQVLRRGVESGFLIKRGKTYQFSAPLQYQIDSNRSRKRPRSPSSAPLVPQSVSSRSEIMNRKIKSPYRRLRGGNSLSSSRESVNQRLRMRNEDEDVQEARTNNAQPKRITKRKRVRFDLAPLEKTNFEDDDNHYDYDL